MIRNLTCTAGDVVNAARTWLGTPYHHQGRLKGVGVDCAGLLVGVTRELGLSDFDLQGYSMRPNGDSLRRICDEQMTPIARDELVPGDVVLFTVDAHPGHLGILTTPNQLIHAYLPRRQVVEHRLDAFWWSRAAGFYRFPGVL
jgi:NlpC/P60 family putative phage cell wall peptidase